MNLTTSLKEVIELKDGKAKAITVDGETVFSPALPDGSNVLKLVKLNQPYTFQYNILKKGDKELKEVYAVQTDPPAVADTPSLPKTAVTSTPAPGGENPVAPAKSSQPVEQKVTSARAAFTSGDYMKPWHPEESFRADRRAMLEAVLESPAVAQAVVGKNDEEIIATIRKVYVTSLALFDEHKNLTK